MSFFTQDPQRLLGDLARLMLEPKLWACLGPALVVLVLFATSIVRRRHPPPLALLALGLLLGLGGTWLAQSHRVLLLEVVRMGLAAGWALWFLLAIVVGLAAVIQPGEPAPVRLGRAARHLGPAMIGTLLLGLYNVEVGWMGLLVVLAALPSTRPSPRVDRAWATATILVACHAGLALGVLLPYSIVDRGDLPLIGLEAWVGLQVLAAWLELRGGEGREVLLRWWPVVVALGVQGALGVLWFFPVESQIAWHTLGRTLPKCRYGRVFNQDSPVYAADDLPETFFGPVLAALEPFERSSFYPDPVVVADADEPLDALLGRPLQVACRSKWGRRYGGAFIRRGAGVEVRGAGVEVVLGSGAPATDAAIRDAALRCGIPELVAPRGDWPAQALVDWCTSEICVTGAVLCTWIDGAWRLR